MRSSIVCATTLGVLFLGHCTPLAASDSVHASLIVTARFEQRMSLSVSTEVLQFRSDGSHRRAVAVVDFIAAARTRADAEIMLIVEPLTTPEPGEDRVQVRLANPASGTGIALDPGRPTVVGRWQGSGSRRGSLAFEAQLEEGQTYTLPVRFVLSTL